MLSETLIKLARISPKYFAHVIRSRNQVLLDRLVKLQPYIGVEFGEIPDDVIVDVMTETKLGCPHCAVSCCEDCLWPEVTDISADFGYDGACTRVDFGEGTGEVLTLRRICELPNIAVVYSRAKECIWLDNTYDPGSVNPMEPVSATDYELCRKFLQAHIDWAKLDCWGADIVPQDSQQTTKEQ